MIVNSVNMKPDLTPQAVLWDMDGIHHRYPSLPFLRLERSVIRLRHRVRSGNV